MIMATNNSKLLLMKKRFINIGLFIGLFAMLSFTACKEDIDPVVEELTFDRAFTPLDLSAVVTKVTTVTVSWTTAKNIDHYVLELYEGSDFAEASLIYSAELEASEETTQSFDYVMPAGDTEFSSRVKAVSSLEGVDESKWATVIFRTWPENKFSGYESYMTGLNQCIIHWEPGVTATALLFVEGTNQTSYTLTAGEIAAGEKTLSDVPNGGYEIRLMNGTFSRGKISLVIEGDLLLGAGEDLATAITALPAGGVLILTNGTSYSFTGPINLTKSIKIRGLYDTDLPLMYTVLDAATYHMFNIDAALTASDSLVFENIEICGYPDNNNANPRLRGMFDQDVALPCTIGEIKYEGCVMRDFDRHLIRLRGTATQVVNAITINDCILYDYAFGSNYGVINSSNAASTIYKIDITNSTIYYTRGAIITYSSGIACDGITISDCTFNQLAQDASSGRYIIDMNNTTSTGTIAINNCVFGNTSLVANGIRPNTMVLSFTGSYYTSDFNDGTTYPIKSYMTAYSGASTALWVDPETTRDFHFLDSSFAGKDNAGDPRWRP